MQCCGGKVPIGDVAGEGVSLPHPRPPEEDRNEDIGFVEVSVVVAVTTVIASKDHKSIVEDARSCQCRQHPAHIAVCRLRERDAS